ncbi:hypothetical protein cyc_00978 [Cyclospora cayetanensis]|uniref:Protein farnesyltransferase/geranylgeranyltransferase type-1 subunit alpha n=1 Tax=Cyclospora cayetanensis TaxID=88456 RepID=A0A1D3D990_9EIME|nr:hypothetical protein cyc_00978 [Cyclospora cayetanensis]
MDIFPRSEVREVAVIAGSQKEEAFLREQHQLYGIVANSGECGIPALLHSPDFLLKNTAAIEANSGDYTSWYLRRRYFSLNPEALDEEELRYCREVCLASIKNYQAWFHRRWLLQRLPPSCFSIEEELDSLKEASSLDLKNYSCWAHRAFLVDTFKLSLEAEVEDTERILQADCFSNSAFSHLFLILKKMAVKAQPQEALSIWTKAIQRYARVFEAQPSNESLPEFQEAVDTLLNVAARVATVAEGGERFALEKCMRLKTTDPIRRFYWAWRAMLLGKKDLALQIVP